MGDFQKIRRFRLWVYVSVDLCGWEWGKYMTENIGWR